MVFDFNMDSISTGYPVIFHLTIRESDSVKNCAVGKNILFYLYLPSICINLVSESAWRNFGGEDDSARQPNTQVGKNQIYDVHKTSTGIQFSDRELRKLKEHKYSSSCASLLDPTMQK